MGSKRFRNCEKMQESCEKIARKLRETLLAKSRGPPQKLNKIKGFRKISTIKTRSFQDRLVVTASIFLHITATHRAAVICREYLRGSEKIYFSESASHTPRCHRGACSPVTSAGILVVDEIFRYSLFGL